MITALMLSYTCVMILIKSNYMDNRQTSDLTESKKISPRTGQYLRVTKKPKYWYESYFD